MNIDLSQHMCYSSVCNLCNSISGPTITQYVSQNTMQNGQVSIDLVNNINQDIYFQVNSNGYTNSSVALRDLKSTDYNITTPTLVSQNGNIYLYKSTISKIDRTKPFTENINLIATWGTSTAGQVIAGYVTATNIRGENSSIYVKPDGVAPTITSVSATSIKESNGWATIKQINVAGTAIMNKSVYVSMYYEDGTIVFENSAANVDNDSYNFSIIPNIEANDPQAFTIKVEDMFGNVVTRTLSLSKIDSQPPTITSSTQQDEEWGTYNDMSLEIREEGSGNLQMAFNNANNYESIAKENDKYLKTYRFIGDAYANVTCAIYLKDGLGNITTEVITLGKIDSTSPTITNITKENNTLTITANDTNTVLNTEGSGIVGYAISSINELPANSSFQQSNQFTIESGIKYYIWALDAAGNVSATNTYE